MTSFLGKHPLPWSLVKGVYEEWTRERDEIRDANDQVVVSTSDASGYQSWFEGDMDNFIEFVNSIYTEETDQ